MARSLRNAVNPLSTGFTRWWCRSDLRAALDGKPRGTYKRLMPRRPARMRAADGTAPMPAMDESIRRARIAAIERIMTRDDPAGPQP
jgi:hypothetical protein